MTTEELKKHLRDIIEVKYNSKFENIDPKIISLSLRNMKINETDLNDMIKELSPYNMDNIPTREYLYLLFNDFKRGTCNNCGKYTGFNGLGVGYNDFCCKKCSAQSTQVKTNKESTNLKKYGVKNISSYDEIKEKKKTVVYNKKLEKLFNNKTFTDINEPLFNINDYNGVDKNYNFKCKKCGNNFSSDLTMNRIPRCKSCYSPYNTSISQLEIFNFLKQYIEEPDIKLNNMKLIKNNEVDITIESLKLGIEFNGLYWHCSINKDDDYHVNKYNKVKDIGYDLINIFEDEWLDKRDIVESILKNKIGKTPNKLYARKCYICEIKDNESVKKFYDENHIQSYCSSCKINIALKHNNEIVSMCSFSKPRFNDKYQYELIRFCSKKDYNIVGGLSKIIKYFTKQYNTASILTYADKRYSNGNGYLKVGFKFIDDTKPNYYYVDGKFKERLSRMSFQKYKLKDKLLLYNDELTERENMEINNYYRIYDCGNKKMEYMV